MKMIVAMLEPHKLPDVKQALYDIQVYNMTVTNALGCSKDRNYTEKYRGVEKEMFLFKKIRLEIAVNDDFVEPVVDAICKGAQLGTDKTFGIIFVSELLDCINITGERGTASVGVG